MRAAKLLAVLVRQHHSWQELLRVVRRALDRWIVRSHLLKIK
jgi:hypothetical protein